MMEKKDNQELTLKTLLLILEENMNFNKYKNIELTKKVDNANCITHSGRFHVDDVISTIF